MKEVLGRSHPRTGVLSKWEFQRYVAEALFEHKRVAISSSRGPGKTYTLGDVVAAFLFVEPSRIVVVGPTMRQIKLGVMAGARAAIKVSTRDLYLERNHAEGMQIDDQHWVIGLPARDPDNMRGFHASPEIPGDPDADCLSEEDIEWLQEQGEDTATRILIVIDEAAGVSAEAFRVLRGMMTKPNVYVILSGNPTLGADTDHDYVRAFHEGSRFHRIRVSALPAEEFPPPAGIEFDKTFDRIPHYLVQPEEIEAARLEYHATDPILLSDWAGVFPAGDSDWRVVPRRVLETAVATQGANLRPLGPRMGVDIGTGSPDLCVASLFVDGEKRIDHRWAPASDDLEAQVSIAGTIMALATKWGAEVEGPGPGGSTWDGEPIPGHRISIDDSGLVGVGDILASRGVFVDRVNFAKSAEGQWKDLVGRTRTKNLRAEMHWCMRRALQEGVAVIPQRFRASWDEATWTTFTRDFDSIGPVIKLERKEDVVKRHGHSPDTFDADLLAMRNPKLDRVLVQTGPRVQTPVVERGPNGQPIRNGRLRKTKLPGARKIR